MLIKSRLFPKKPSDIKIYDDFYKDVRNIDVALYLINHVKSNRDNPEITYGELADRVGDELTARTIEPYLGNISEVCKENNFPLLSAIVVNSETKIPGDGFFKFFFGKCDLEFEINTYTKCRNAIIAFNRWKELEDVIRRRQR